VECHPSGYLLTFFSEHVSFSTYLHYGRGEGSITSAHKNHSDGRLTRMKTLKVFVTICSILVFLVIVVIAFYQPPRESDFGVYTNLRNFTVGLLKQYQARERAITEDFKDFSLKLAFPYSKLFGSSTVGIPLASYENDHITAATISQFEIPPRSGYCRDFTFNVRPHFEYRAPVFHIDFMKPSPGVPGLCSMDFFNVDPERINLESFFGDELSAIQKAMSLVEKYQRTVEQGRGKITAYLDPWKSPYRMELQEPKTKDEEQKRHYYETVGEAYKLALTAYIKSLHRLAPDPSYAQRHEGKTRELVQALYIKDFAVNMGKKIFKDSFKKYWIDGFWTVEIDMKN